MFNKSKRLYNFVGDKIKENESDYDVAYRELFEATRISYNDIELEYFVDSNYYKYENTIQFFMVYVNIEKNKKLNYNIDKI